MKVVLAHRILADASRDLSSRTSSSSSTSIHSSSRSTYFPRLFRRGISIQSAVEAGLEYMRSKVNGFGGVVAVDGDGVIAMHHTTKRMAWAKAEERNGGIVRGGIKL